MTDGATSISHYSSPSCIQSGHGRSHSAGQGEKVRQDISLRRLSTHKNTGIEHRTPAGVRPSFQASQVNQHSAPAARSHACTSTLARPCPRSYAAHYKTRIRPDLSKKGGKGSKRKQRKQRKEKTHPKHGAPHHGLSDFQLSKGYINLSKTQMPSSIPTPSPPPPPVSRNSLSLSYPHFLSTSLI